MPLRFMRSPLGGWHTHIRENTMRMIVDTDAGVDDAVALMMALRYPGVTVEAITTTYGNVSLEKVVANVLTIVQVMGCDVPVYRGADSPLVADWQAESVHGSDGLGDWAARPAITRKTERQPAAQALVELVNAHPGELTLVALGPLTNIALATLLDPEFPRKLKTFVFMGGTIEARGNTNMVSAEWNIYCDPEAAYRVLKAFPHSAMLSWETTLRHGMTWAQYDAMTQTASPTARFFTAITQDLMSRWRKPNSDFIMPDPLAMAAALDPTVITRSSTRYVSVEMYGALTRGQTVIDHRGRLGYVPNLEIIEAVDDAKFYNMMRGSLI
jgi:purine nucleosidase